MEEKHIMTIIYRKRDKMIFGICNGKADVDIVATNMDIEDARIIFDKIEVEYDRYIIDNSHMFVLNDDLEIVMSDEYKQRVQKYL